MGGNEPGVAQRLAELVAARLCHDLGGPLSIIGNAAELARLETERGARQGGEAMALMVEGAQAVGARVKLLRALFGPATGPLSAEDIAAMARGVVGGGRVEADLSHLSPGTVFGAEAARAVLAALVVAGEALPRGGTVRVHGGADDLALMIEGANAAWPASLSEAVASEDPVAVAVAGGARALMGPMLVLLARAAGFRPMLLMGPGVPLLRLARTAA
ncbi:MAG: histidine phosphotransferase family protein [Acetobacteraceae bacterium]|jgi:histidine phosphotransferase ChpT|nr:histidine phosphotransferase family protein [Acetobacteraceae bacterium]